MRTDLKVEEARTDELVPYAGNAKEHPEWQVEHIANSIEQFGFNDPIGIWHDSDGIPVIVEGHGRLLAAKRLGMETVPVVALDHMDDDARRAYTHVHNQTTLTSGLDDALLEIDLSTIPGFDWSDFGFNYRKFDDLEDGAVDTTGEQHGNLAAYYGYVPFSVIRTTTGEWRERKAAWLGLGITSELGRGDGLISGGGSARYF